MLWRDMMRLKMSEAPLDPRTSSLVLLPTNLKSTVVQYRGRGLGMECGRIVEQLMTVQTL